MTPEIVYLDRATGKRVTETVMGARFLRWAYESLAGRTLAPLLFGSRVLSSLLGLYYDSRFSRKAIASLAHLSGCRAEEAARPLSDYPSFNAFFTRTLKKGARPLGRDFVSPADGRIRLFLNASLDDPFPLKGATRTLREVMGGEALESSHWDVAVVRLAPVDYHRFHFPCACQTKQEVRIKRGLYHSVNPIALVRHPDIYALNERHILTCQTAFGPLLFIEVGAFGVGTIVQTFEGTTHAKGDEKGYFKFGGSTVILATQAHVLHYDEDLVQASAEGLEVRLSCGEHIAYLS